MRPLSFIASFAVDIYVSHSLKAFAALEKQPYVYSIYRLLCMEKMYVIHYSIFIYI